MVGTGEGRRGEEGVQKIPKNVMDKKRKKNKSVRMYAIIGRGVNSGVRLSYVLLMSTDGGLQEGFKEPQQHHKASGGRGLPSRG